MMHFILCQLFASQPDKLQTKQNMKQQQQKNEHKLHISASIPPNNNQIEINDGGCTFNAQWI
jgi:HSP90 family molecular chaperone